ncbi:MAG: ABC transporter substrate-binding protein [Rhodocyclaceae bacterium]|nr:ABC transporter substrate-binding protein [Rhodocyclaceae bacterium]MBX3667814.1 ABC transporter substrate-binding protein [Rhodocyclaceae bacterium]
MAASHLIISRLALAESPEREPSASIFTDLDFRAESGDCIALMGAPGCGKAELLQILAGNLRATSGGVILDGREICGPAAGRSIVGKEPRLRAWLTAHAYVARSARAAWKKRKAGGDIDEWVRHNLHLTGAADAASLRPGKLSAALRLRVELARVLASDPKLLLLDDAFGTLDAGTRAALHDTFLAMQQRVQHTAILVTENLAEAVLLADRILILTRGGGVKHDITIDLLRPRSRAQLVTTPEYEAYVAQLRKLLSETSAAAPAATPQAQAMPAPEAMLPHPQRHPMPSGKVLEKPALSLGYVPLSDCAPLAVALEEGFFDGYGLDITLVRETSWQNVLDKVSMGLLDGAQMPAPMLLGAHFSAAYRPLVTSMSLGLNGNAITVASDIYARMRATGVADLETPLGSARALRAVIDANRRERRPPLVFAVVAAFSSHNYLLRYWMASAGIDPDRDIRLAVIPPPQMAHYLQAGLVSGFCVGEPWNTVVARNGTGRVVVNSYAIWNNHPEKVLAVTRAWADAHPNTHRAVIKALLDACWWIEKDDRRPQLTRILSQGRYLNMPQDDLEAALDGVYLNPAGTGQAPPLHAFHRDCANFPWRSHALWLLAQMRRWGHIQASTHELQHAARSVYRPELYREAARARGVPAPCCDLKPEGAHESEWQLEDSKRQFLLGSDRFMDGRLFDPEQLDHYLAGFEPAKKPAPRPAPEATRDDRDYGDNWYPSMA